MILALLPSPVYAATQEASTLSGLSDIYVSDIGYHGANINWKTDVPATSQVFYDTEFHQDIADYAYHTIEDITLVIEHSISLTGLASRTTYHFRVRSVVDGIETISSDYAFTTRTPGGPGHGPAPHRYYLKFDFLGETSKWRISSSGCLPETVDITSGDGEINICIPKNTFCLDKDGNRLRELVIKVEGQAPPLPEDYLILSKAYDLSPDGATFNPYLRLTLAYEEGDIPEGIEEEALYIAYYSHGWIPLDSVVDAQGDKVFTELTHLTPFAIMAKLSPLPSAEFAMSNLTISPTEVKVGEELTITVEVTNIGGREGSHLLSLWINGVSEETKEVILAPKAVKTIVFTVTRDEPGSYSVEVDGLIGSFTVKEKPVPQPINWPLIATIIAGTIAVGLAIFFLIRKK